MSTTLQTDSRPTSPGGFWSQCLVIVVIALTVLATARPVDAQGRRGHVARDLAAHLDRHDPSSVDVIVSGNAAFIDQLVRRHGAQLKKSLKTGAVLTVSGAALEALADDADVGALSGDGEMRSQLAHVTEMTGAAAAWAGEISQLGAVVGKGVGVAIVDSGVAPHTALAGRLVASVDFTLSLIHI